MAREHTPGPWRYEYGSVYFGPSGSDDPGSRIAMMDRDEPETCPTERDANAVRIVACVNGCDAAGIVDPAGLAALMAGASEALSAMDTLASDKALPMICEHSRETIRAALRVVRGEG